MKKLSKTIKFSLLLILLSLASGVTAGVVSHRLGLEALKGINQPDNNPSKKFSSAQKLSGRPKPFEPISEKDIIKKTEKIILDKQAQAKKDRQKPSP